MGMGQAMSTNVGVPLPNPTSNRVPRKVGDRITWQRHRDYHLDDRNDIDGAGASDMSTAIAAYLTEAATDGFKRVYSEAGKTYLLGSQVDVPTGVVWEGPSGLNAASGDATLPATLKANANALTMVKLNGWYAGLRGLKIDLNSKTTAVGVRPNLPYQTLDECWFTNVASGSTAVKGGGILYFRANRCLFNAVTGRAFDLLNAYGDFPETRYYGVNVGDIEGCWFYGSGDMIRHDGIINIRSCDFEGAYAGTTGVIDLGGVLNAHVNLEDNYFELSGSGTHVVAVYLQAASVLLRARGNEFYGSSSGLAGSAAIEFGGYAPHFDIQGNEFYRWETGIKNVRPATDSAIDIGANYFASTVATKITYHSAMTTKVVTGAPVGHGMIANPDKGLRVYGMAINGTVVYHEDPVAHLNINLAEGNVYHLAYTGSASPTASNATPGMRFTLYFATGNTTLTNATWHVAEGANTLMSSGTSRDFFVDYNSVIREVHS